MLLGVAAILAGFVLLGGVLRSSSNAARFARALTPFQTIIGIAVLILGLINLLSNPLVAAVTLLGGLVLAAQAVSALPGIGPALERAGALLANVGALLGVLLVALGLFHLFQTVL